MKFTKQGVVCLVAVAAIVIAAVALLLSRPANEQPTPSAQTETTSVKLPETVFDTSYALGDSGVTIQYPAKGFYGLGANVVKQSAEGSVMGDVHIETTATFDPSRTAQFVTMDAKVSQTNMSNLEAFVASIPRGGYEGSYVDSDGKYVTVNGRRYFVYRVTEDVTVWQALSLEGSQLTSVSLAYKRGDAQASLAAYKNNDDLFMAVLSHITYR